jgi:hypothetical protein
VLAWENTWNVGLLFLSLDYLLCFVDCTQSVYSGVFIAIEADRGALADVVVVAHRAESEDSTSERGCPLPGPDVRPSVYDHRSCLVFFCAFRFFLTLLVCVFVRENLRSHPVATMTVITGAHALHTAIAALQVYILFESMCPQMLAFAWCWMST